MWMCQICAGAPLPFPSTCACAVARHLRERLWCAGAAPAPSHRLRVSQRPPSYRREPLKKTLSGFVFHFLKHRKLCLSDRSLRVYSLKEANWVHGISYRGVIEADRKFKLISFRKWSLLSRQARMEGKAVFGGGQGKGGEADNKLNIDSIIARLLEGDLINKLHIDSLEFSPSNNICCFIVCCVPLARQLSHLQRTMRKEGLVRCFPDFLKIWSSEHQFSGFPLPGYLLTIVSRNTQ